MQIPDYRDAETEGLIREYQKNAKPTPSNIKILEFYGGEDWRTNKGEKTSRSIQRLVEEELVKDYQMDSKLDKETRQTLEEGVGARWREDQGVAGRGYILRIIKEEWGNLKPSILRYHRGLREELEIGWIQNLKIDLHRTSGPESFRRRMEGQSGEIYLYTRRRTTKDGSF